jgi:hypothetical protein
LKWMYKTIAEMPGEMTIKDHLRNDAILHRLEVTEARETLGLWIAMDGNQQQQVLALIMNVLVWTDKIRTKHLTKTEAWLSLRMGISKALQYPLAATSLSKIQCKLIDKKLLKAALPALGFPSSFPQVIAQAPPEVLGLGIPALWNQQGIEHVAVLLRHGDSPANNVTRCLLRDVMATLRLELGLPGVPFEHSYQLFQLCTTPTYLHTAWEFCNDHAFVVQDNQPNLKPQRTNDQFLMQAFADAGYNKKDLRLLNLCRLWAKVISVADITSGAGTHLIPEALERNFTSYQHNDRKWPTAGKPNTHCWTLWAQALAMCFLCHLEPQHKLCRPLGAWKTRPVAWKWFYSDSLDCLLETGHNDSWRKYDRQHNNQATRHQGFHRTNTRLEGLPLHAPRLPQN